jgi:predicted nucleic acid-binding Zn ribbon protein
VLRRVFSPVGIVFKGSGFYRTDSRGKPSSSSKADGRGDGADKAKKAADNNSGSKSSSSDGASSGSTTKAAEKSA